MAGMTGKSVGAIHGQKTFQAGQQTGTQQTQFRPEDLAALQQSQQGLLQQTQRQQQLAQNLQQQAAQQGAPQLQTGFNQLQNTQAFQPGQAGIDNLGRAQIALGQQALQQQAGAQQRAIAQQFAGQPGIAQALGRQASMRSALQANPLLAQAAQGAAERGQLGFQNVLNLAGQQANLQQSANQAALQQAAAQQSARQEQLGLGGSQLQAQQALLPMLSQLAQQLGVQVSSGTQNAQNLQGGIKQNAK